MEHALSVHNTIGAGSTGSHNRKHEAGLLPAASGCYGPMLTHINSLPLQQETI
jgi:hypothetical protein